MSKIHRKRGQFIFLILRIEYRKQNCCSVKNKKSKCEILGNQSFDDFTDKFSLSLFFKTSLVTLETFLIKRYLFFLVAAQSLKLEA